MHIAKNAKNISVSLIVAASVFFLSGCYYNQPQQQVLRDADQYNIKSYQDRNADNSPAAHRLTLAAPQGEPAASGQNQAANQTDTNSKQPPTMQIDKTKNYSAISQNWRGGHHD